MTLTRDKELWSIALWIEKEHGDEGGLYIAQQMDRLLKDGEPQGLALWLEIRERFEALSAGETTIETQ